MPEIENELDEDFYGPADPPDRCPTCDGRGTVNPLTAPERPGFFCVGTTLCPDCEGSGEFDW